MASKPEIATLISGQAWMRTYIGHAASGVQEA